MEFKLVLNKTFLEYVPATWLASKGEHCGPFGPKVQGQSHAYTSEGSFAHACGRLLVGIGLEWLSHGSLYDGSAYNMGPMQVARNLETPVYTG